MRKMRGTVSFDDAANTYRVQVFYEVAPGVVIEGPPEGGDQATLLANAVARGATTWDGTDVDMLLGTVERVWPTTPSDPPYVDPPTGGP